MTVQAYIYDHSNDGSTAAIRFHQTAVRDLQALCTGEDQNLGGRTLAEYIDEADHATVRPESFFRNVDILWRHPTITLPNVFATGRRLRVTYSGNVRSGGGMAFEGYCVVSPDWFSTLLPMAPTQIEVEYIPGESHDLIIVVG